MNNLGNKYHAKKEPTLTAQIAVLVAKKKAVKEGQLKKNKSMETYQQRLDDSIDKLTDTITTQLSDDTPETRDAVSEARVAKNVIMNELTQHNEDIKTLPGAVEKLDKKINVLTAEKKIKERELIADKAPPLADIEEEAPCSSR